MEGPNQERWRDLCAQAATEHDPEKLLELIKEINNLLEEKRQRLSRNSTAPTERLFKRR
jgi:7,8-dihydro-6-hydroxymethylpterin-pyrophosphokinase